MDSFSHFLVQMPAYFFHIADTINGQPGGRTQFVKVNPEMIGLTPGYEPPPQVGILEFGYDQGHPSVFFDLVMVYPERGKPEVVSLFQDPAPLEKVFRQPVFILRTNRCFTDPKRDACKDKPYDDKDQYAHQIAWAGKE